MKTTRLQALLVIGIVAGLCGCGPSSPPAIVQPTGFLSDYSGLEEVSATTRLYVNPKYDLSEYASFIVDPVQVYFKDGTEVLDWGDAEKLRAYMRRAIISTLEPRYTAVATAPAPGTARVRIALTNVERSSPLKLGSVSMEAELLDSQTGEQMTAIIESQRKRVRFPSYDRWAGAKAVMDDWAKGFYTSLEDARAL
jgi:hypothetical protein